MVDTDLFKNVYIFSVSELTGKIKGVLDNDFSAVCVEGEVSNFSVAASGHAYFTLKDKNSQLKSVLFKGNRKKIKFDIENGLHIICFGRVTVYRPRGEYQIVIEHVEPKGLGALQLAFEQLKKKLEKKGFFDKEHKKSIPYLPAKIGIVTSASGKAIRDILNIIDRRFSNLEIFLIPVRVQGKKSAEEIVEAIRMFNRYKKVDVIIIGRGGGSLEDLWSFNEEIVAEAIYDSNIPIISAVGHEPDVTISDLVSDLRVPTPSAAAELVVERKRELEDKIDRLFLKLNNVVLNKTDFLNNRLENIVDTYFLKKYPVDLLLQNQQMLDDFSDKMERAIDYIIKLKQEKIQGVTARLEGLNPGSILSRGYSITVNLKDNKVIKDSNILNEEDKIKTILNRGVIKSEVKKITYDNNKDI